MLKTYTSQITQKNTVLKVAKRKPKCSSVRRICVICMTAAIHPNAAEYDARVCAECAASALPGCSSPGSRASCARPSGSPADAQGGGRGPDKSGHQGAGDPAGKGGFPPDVADLFARAEARARSRGDLRFVDTMKRKAFVQSAVSGKYWARLRAIADGTSRRKPPRQPSPVPVTGERS